MDIRRAKQLVLAAVDRLKETGIQVAVTPSPARDDAVMVAKHAGAADRLPASEWVRVTFVPMDTADAVAVYQASVELANAGIAFDAGGDEFVREWEIDHSLRFESNTRQATLRLAVLESALASITRDVGLNGE